MFHPNFFSLNKEQEFDDYVETQEDKFLRALDLEISNVVQANTDQSSLLVFISQQKIDEMQAVEEEIAQMQQQLEVLRDEQSMTTIQREIISVKAYETKVLESLMMEKLNILEMKQNELVEDVRSLTMDIERLDTQLKRFSQLTCVNELFHIWFEGAHGTINNFRLGYLRANDEKAIAQTDAALGQAALVVDTIATCSRYRFQQYQVLPMGSTAKISKVDDRSTVHPLHIDQGAFTMFPRRNFNSALTGFMTCITELGEFIASYDPTMSMPFPIIIADSLIGDVSFTFGDDLEKWTRAMKFMLTNIKWIVAWFTKHSRNMTVTE